MTGAAALCNELIALKSPFCWERDYGELSIVSVILQTVKELEVEFDCINPDDNNAVLLQNKQNELQDLEEKLRRAPLSLLMED